MGRNGKALISRYTRRPISFVGLIIFGVNKTKQKVTRRGLRSHEGSRDSKVKKGSFEKREEEIL